jgi:hypothetical protein
MDHIRNIQELIDENRESLPTALSVDVMRECQNAYETLPKLWKIYYIELVATGKNRITEEPKVVIVEEEPVRQVRYYWLDLIKSAKIPPREKHGDIRPVDKIVHGNDGSIRIITKVEPFLKRARIVLEGDND